MPKHEGPAHHPPSPFSLYLQSSGCTLQPAHCVWPWLAAPQQRQPCSNLCGMLRKCWRGTPACQRDLQVTGRYHGQHGAAAAWAASRCHVLGHQIIQRCMAGDHGHASSAATAGAAAAAVVNTLCCSGQQGTCQPRARHSCGGRLGLLAWQARGHRSCRRWRKCGACPCCTCCTSCCCCPCCTRSWTLAGSGQQGWCQVGGKGRHQAPKAAFSPRGMQGVHQGGGAWVRQPGDRHACEGARKKSRATCT